MSASAAIATNRFGLGAKAGEIDRAARNPKAWLLQQIEGRYVEPPEFKGLLPSTEIRKSHWHRYGHASPTLNKKLEAAQASGDKAAMDAASKDVQRMLGGYVNWATQIAHTEFGARTRHALATDRPFEERLARFWSNHLVVPTAKVPATILVGAYEREVIRPHATGKFSDMLMASAKHAAMLTFLDNDTSIGPNSSFGRARKMGLNENLGREILELHTMGVDGGYSQADVLALAKALTGWNTAPAILRANTTYASAIDLPQRAPDGPYAFAFYPEWHEPGAFTMLGKTYSQAGVAQAESMLRDLARHPATARYVATKFARHFVGDEPSDALVKRLAAVYLAHDTDIGEMARALVESPESWQPAKRKLKQPEDYAVSGLRGLGVRVAAPAPYPAYRFETYRPRAARGDGMMSMAPGASMSEARPGAMMDGAAVPAEDRRAGAMMSEGSVKPGQRRRAPGMGKADDGAIPAALLYNDLAKMGQKPYGAPGPQGWYDRTSDWSGAASLVKRIQWSVAVAAKYAGQAPEASELVGSMLGASASEALRTEISRAATREQGVALLLASAEFQRR